MKRINIDKYCGLCARQFTSAEDFIACPSDGEALLPVKHDPFLGVLVGGKYKIDEFLGAGGWSVVYRATDTKLARTVAFKLLRYDFVSTPSKLKRFEREAKLVSAMNHQNVCAVYDFGFHNEQPYLVLEYLNGDSLADRVLKGPLPAAECVEVMLKVAGGLAAAHARGIIHRDLKPANIMLTEDGGVKIIDFGLAKTSELIEAEQITQTGLTIGTPAYMSPEQVRGMPLDSRSDIYSAGCILYEMLTGVHAVSGRTVFEVMQKHAEGELIIADPEARIPQPLKDVVARCLERDREKRYQTVEELSKDLRLFKERGMIAALPKFRLPNRRTLVTVAGTAAISVAATMLVWNVVLPAVQNQTTASQLSQLETESKAENYKEAKAIGDKLMAKLERDGKQNSDAYFTACQLTTDAQLRIAHKQAIPYLQKLTKLIAEREGPESKSLCVPTATMGWVSLDMQKFDDAVKYYAAAVPLYRKHFHPQDAAVEEIITYLGWAYSNTGDFEQARQLGNEALKLYSDVTSPSHVQNTLTMVAYAEEKTGHFDDANKHWKQALDIAVNPVHRHKIAAGYGKTLLLQKKYKEAEQYLRSAIKGLEPVWASEPATYRLALSDYVWLLRETHREVEADKIERDGKI